MSSLNSRREFLKRASSLSVTGVAAPWALNLAAIGEAAAQSDPTDYKALVCIFLFGGNDHGNTLVPYDTATHNTYLNLRGGFGGLGLARNDLASTLLAPSKEFSLAEGRQYALAPSLSLLKPMFDANRMAVLLNIGTLIEPTTAAQYAARSVLLPPKLFSHNDQQSVWQASSPEGASTGWGGRMGDLFASGNGKATFTAVSAAGNAVYLSGKSTSQYQVSSSGSVKIGGSDNGDKLYGSADVAAALRSIIGSTPSINNFELEYTRIVKRSIEANLTLTSALSPVAPSLVIPTTPTGLSAQLNIVARMIAARQTLGAKRQVFFVGMGGFDLHDNLLETHPILLTQVADAMAAFDRAMIQMDVSTQVTTFTASDFGRTLASNGDGSDHGWGSYHFVTGGAVKGGRYFGEAPSLGNGSDDDIGQGRMLPAIAVDQLAATLATWMGVSKTDLTTVVPGIVNYSLKNLGIFG
jgi:uncharacterized protein (DUF1501 family)